MKHIMRIMFSLILLPALSNAQSNYKPGYVVTLKGDTLNGFIDLREWDMNPAKINFKAFQSNEVSKYTAKDIKYFNVSNLVEYQRFAGVITLDHINPALMNMARDTSFRIDTVFLQILQKGKNLALYTYSDEIKQRFYISESPDYAPVELSYRLYYDSDHVTLNRGRTVNENTYMKQLFALSQKYGIYSDSFQKDLEDAGYREYNLLKVVGTINGIDNKRVRKKH